ncbi:MAG: hypothetical protein AAFV88_21520 [Planctomycetota bacterium]
MNFDFQRRIPIYSIAAGAVVAIALTTCALLQRPVPPVALGALGLAPLAAALVDALRTLRRPTQPIANTETPQMQEAEDWIKEQSVDLDQKRKRLQEDALSIQQWLQFPQTIDFRAQSDVGVSSENPAVSTAITGGTNAGSSAFSSDPLTAQDQKLLALIDAKTKDLFERIKADDYRTDVAGEKTVDIIAVRRDFFALVSEVTSIYRPDDPSPFLKTNAEAVSRAFGRGALRLLVAADQLPGGISGYDFQSLYNVMRRGVQAYGMYRSAKPYLDVASGLWFAGRLASSTNPVTYVAWWAASKATTYGASKLSEHVIDQQAVGLIRQLVEIVAVEVASIYSPQVRYRDLHWIYGVELVHMISELQSGQDARLEAMRQIATLKILDEYGRMSLLRQLSLGVSRLPHDYRPSESLPPRDRMIIVEKLESFLLEHVLVGELRPDEASLQRWQQAAADRLEVQFRASEKDVPVSEQTERCVWALASFALEHLRVEPEELPSVIKDTSLWQSANQAMRSDWEKSLQENPPYLYHPPSIDPSNAACKSFMKDLVSLALSDEHGPSMAKRTSATESALRVSAYFLRTSADEVMGSYFEGVKAKLLGKPAPTSLSENVLRSLLQLLADESNDCESSSTTPPVTCLFEEVVVDDEKPALLARLNRPSLPSELVCFRDASDPAGNVIEVLERCDYNSAKISKVAGYVRSDCEVKFPSGTKALIAGSTLRGYDATFEKLLAPCPGG